MSLSLKWQFVYAERQQESGGNYGAVNSGSGALGAYQVMPANLPQWLADAGLPPMSPQQYLGSPSAQDQLAYAILGGYYDQYGAPGAAAMWYSGQPNPEVTYGDPPVYVYVQDVLALFYEQNNKIVTYGPGGVGADYSTPPPNTADWSPTIRSTGNLLKNAGGRLNTRSVQIANIR